MTAENGPSIKEIGMAHEMNNRIDSVKDKLVKTNFLKPKEKEKDKLNDELKKIFTEEFNHGCDSVEKMRGVVAAFNVGSKSVSEQQAKNNIEDLKILGTATRLAVETLTKNDKPLADELFLGSKHVESMLPVALIGLEKNIIKNNVSNEEIDKQLNLLQMTRKNIKDGDETMKEIFAKKIDITVNNLLNLNLDNENDVSEQDAVLAVLIEEKKKYKKEEVLKQEVVVLDGDGNPIEGINPRAMKENRHGGEYMSPYDVTPDNFVDSLFNQANPRLYFTPPPEWVRKLSPDQQYLLKIQQRLADGAVHKLGVKDIDPAKVRQNEIYNFPTTELRLIYEMPGVREAMQTFVGELFEKYTEDGRVLLRIKQSKNINDVKEKEKYYIDGQGYVRSKKGDNFVIDKKTKENFGDIGVGQSFEDYKREMFIKMALKKLHPGKTDQINKDWRLFYDEEIKNYIENYKKNSANLLDKEKGKYGRTDVELERKWMVENALEERRAVATAWNFLFVGNIVESADIYRQLKPTQVNSDKMRTFMMPLEKFLQKMSVKEETVQGTEEFFGGNIALWARKMLGDPEQGADFRKKILYAANHDRTEMTDEEAQWRLFPKRVMCSMVDMYVVETEETEKLKKKNGGQEVLRKTMAEALYDCDEIKFKDDDADVFVSLRDTWDELITVMPFLIGKPEYSPVQQKEKFALGVEKMKGLVTGIEKIKLTETEAAKRLQELERNKKEYGKDYKPWEKYFSREKFVDTPEFYAWLIANSVGMETNLDIPLLNKTALKADKDTYNDHVNNFVRLLNLDPEKSTMVKNILNAKNWLSSRNAINAAERRAANRETIRRRAERKAK